MSNENASGMRRLENQFFTGTFPYPNQTPSGVDLEAAQGLGVKVIWALSLPGKVAPVTAGRAIQQTVYHILQEVGIS